MTWDQVPFADVADYQVGRTPSRSNAGFWEASDNPTAWVTISDMRPYGNVRHTKEAISGEAFRRVFGGAHAPAGTLIMSFKLTIGRVATLGVPAVHNEAIISIFPKPGIDQRFLGYYLSQVDYAQFQDRQIKGNTLNKSKIDRIPVPVVDVSEQVAIADHLDAIRCLIETEREALATTRELLQVLGRTLTAPGKEDAKAWVFEPIGDRHEVSSGATPSRSVPDYWEGGTVPWVKTAEVNYRVIKQTSEKITEKGLEDSAAKILPAGTVVMAMYGQGKTRGQVGMLGIDAAMNQACAAIKSIDGLVDPRYLYQYLALQYEEVRALAHGGQQQNLNLDIVRDFPIAYPADVAEQVRIAGVLEALRAKADLHVTRARHAEALFDATLRDLMYGNLRIPGVVADEPAL